MTDELLRELGPGFILVAVDHPEAAGGRAVLGQCSAVHCGITGLSDQQIGSSAPLRLAKLVDEKSLLPPDEIVAIGSKEQVPYRTRSDSTWVAQAEDPIRRTTFLPCGCAPAAGEPWFVWISLLIQLCRAGGRGARATGTLRSPKSTLSWATMRSS